MNLLIHMGDSYPNETPAAKRMRAFSDVLTAKGHRVVVLAPCNDAASNHADNVLVCPTVKIKKKTTLMRTLNQLSFAISSVFVAARAGKADVVLTTAPPALIGIAGWFIAKCKRAKLVYDVRDIWPDVAWEMGSFGKDSMYSKVFAFVRDFMLRRSDLVTAVSPGKVEKLKKYNPNARVAFITNGLDETFLNNTYRPEIAKEHGMGNGFHCVYIGNLGWAQGLTQMMHLAERSKAADMGAQFILFGTGVDETSLRQYATEHELTNVTFAGRLPNADMYTVLRSAQLSFVSLVNESLKDSVPTKMFEALGVGCPVLLAAVGDAADILEECKLGIAVPPNDSEALWNAFVQIYENQEQFKRYTEHAKNVVINKYSRQNAALLLEQELLSIL